MILILILNFRSQLYIKITLPFEKSAKANNFKEFKGITIDRSIFIWNKHFRNFQERSINSNQKFSFIKGYYFYKSFLKYKWRKVLLLKKNITFII